MLTLAIMVASIALATIYGVLFALTFPLVQIDASIASLCAVLGLVTSLLCIGIWRLVRRK